MNQISEEFVKVSKLLKRYLRLEVDYIKLTVAEKASLLISALAVGVVFLAIVCFMLLLLSFACAELFRLIMSPALSYVATAGVFLLILLIMIIFREKWIINPISRFLTKVLFDKDEDI